MAIIPSSAPIRPEARIPAAGALTLHVLHADDLGGGSGRAVSGPGMRQALAWHLGTPPADDALWRNSEGKPALRCGTVQFNVSHAGPWLYVLVGSAPVGVDVERLRPLRGGGALAAYFAALGGAPAVPADVPRLWSRAEAVGKCLGTGMTLPLDRLDLPAGTLAAPACCRTAQGAVWLATAPAPQGWCAHIASAGPFGRLDVVCAAPRRALLAGAGNMDMEWMDHERKTDAILR